MQNNIKQQSISQTKPKAADLFSKLILRDNFEIQVLGPNLIKTLIGPQIRFLSKPKHMLCVFNRTASQLQGDSSL